MFKETPILLTISIIEMMSQALIIGKDKFKYTDRLTAPRCRHGLCAGRSALASERIQGGRGTPHD